MKAIPDLSSSCCVPDGTPTLILSFFYRTYTPDGAVLRPISLAIKSSFFLGVVLLFAFTVQAQQRKIGTKDLNKLSESVDKRIDSITSNFADSLQTIHSKLAEIKEKDQEFDWKSAVPWLLTVLTIIISYSVYKREGSFKNLNFLAEVDKLLIGDPRLWALYDDHKKTYSSTLTISNGEITINGQEEFNVMGKGKLEIKPFIGTVDYSMDKNVSVTIGSATRVDIPSSCQFRLKGNATLHISGPLSIEIKSQIDKDVEGKIRALCYYKLNSFEVVFKYNQWSPFKNKVNKVWEDYMIDSIIESTYFRKIVEKESVGYIYSDSYQKKMTNFLTLYNIIKMCVKAQKVETDGKENGIKNKIKAVIDSRQKILRAVKIKPDGEDITTEEVETLISKHENKLVKIWHSLQLKKILKINTKSNN